MLSYLMKEFLNRIHSIRRFGGGEGGTYVCGGGRGQTMERGINHKSAKYCKPTFPFRFAFNLHQCKQLYKLLLYLSQIKTIKLRLQYVFRTNFVCL